MARLAGVFATASTPSPAEGRLDGLLQEAFPHYDEVALGGAFGVTATAVLALATALLLWGPNDGFVPMLSLLGNYLFGYEVSWPGLLLGMVEAGLAGFMLSGGSWPGSSTCSPPCSSRDLERRLATLTTLEAVDGGTR